MYRFNIVLILSIAVGLSACGGGDSSTGSQTDTSVCVLNANLNNQTISKLGMTPTFKGDIDQWNNNNMIQSINLTHDFGVDVVHFSFSWNEIQPTTSQFNWDNTDAIINAITNNGQKLSMVLPSVNTAGVVDLPSDIAFTGFLEPTFRSQYQNFIVAFVNRYGNKISYLWLGNEIDEYFFQNPAQIPDYVQLFNETKDLIKATTASINVGVIFTYHDALTNGNTDLYNEFAAADILGFTLYTQFLSTTPDDYEQRVNDLLALTQSIGSKIAITETSWSSNGKGGSIQGQKQFIRSALSAFTNNHLDIEFFAFWGTYDLSRTFVDMVSFGDPDFDNWFASLSFITSAGEAKSSYCTFVDELRML